MKFLYWLDAVRAVLRERGWIPNNLDASLQALPWLWFNLFHSCGRDIRYAADSIETYYMYEAPACLP